MVAGLHEKGRRAGREGVGDGEEVMLMKIGERMEE
jgi:hypothetical protein